MMSFLWQDFNICLLLEQIPNPIDDHVKLWQGIYETKIPPEFNAILQIGCVCKVDKSAKKGNLQDGWSLSELHMKTTTECPYLENSIPFLYLYHRYMSM